MSEEDLITGPPAPPIEVIVVEENIKTGGHYQAQSFKIDIDSDGINQNPLSFPIPISLLSAKWTCKSAHKDDEIELVVGDGITIGVLTANAVAGATVLDVSQTVIDNTAVGYYLTIGSQSCERVIFIDEENLQVTIETALVYAENAGQSVKQCIKLFPKGKLPAEGIVNLGDSKIGGSYIPANTIIYASYWRKGGGDADDFIFFMEYLY